jgi:TetR/AcrR family transcriptional regulator, mexJK operon transcriptional repressor
MSPDDLITESEGSGREDAKEQQILSAGLKAFMELGFAATSMDEVARRARASKTTLYSRFPSKEALFSAAVSAECTRRTSFTPHELDGLPVEEALQLIGRRFTDLVFSPEAIRIERIVTGEAANFPEVAKIFYCEGPEKITRVIAQYLAAATERGDLSLADPVFAAGQFLIALKGKAHCELTFGQRLPPSAEEREQLVRQVVSLFLDGARPRQER